MDFIIIGQNNTNCFDKVVPCISKILYKRNSIVHSGYKTKFIIAESNNGIEKYAIKKFSSQNKEIENIAKNEFFTMKNYIEKQEKVEFYSEKYQKGEFFKYKFFIFLKISNCLSLLSKPCDSDVVFKFVKSIIKKLIKAKYLNFTLSSISPDNVYFDDEEKVFFANFNTENYFLAPEIKFELLDDKNQIKPFNNKAVGFSVGFMALDLIGIDL